MEPRGARVGRWVTVGLIVAVAAILIAGIVELTQQSGGCTRDQDCPANQHCTAGKCRADCTPTSCPSGQTCDPTTHECTTAGSCHKTGCPSGQHCDPGTGACVADCTATSCTAPLACGPAGICVCPGGGIPTKAGQCQAPVSKQPKNCQALKTSVADDAVAVQGQPGVYYCTGVAGADADLADGGGPPVDQVFADHFDDFTKLTRSFPGNSANAYDASKVSLINPSGCLAPKQTTDPDGTGNCSRGPRLSSLFVGTPSADRKAAFAEVRDISQWQAVGDTFLAQHKIWGSTGTNWTSSGCHVGNIYPRPTDGGVEPGVRMRVTGDLWGVAAPAEGKPPVSSDGVPMVPGLYPVHQGAVCSDKDPSAPQTADGAGGCGGTKLTCGTSCQKTGQPEACMTTVPVGTKQKKLSTCDPASPSASNPCLLQTQCDAFRQRDPAADGPTNPALQFPPLAWNKGVTDATARDPAGLMTEQERTAYARVGATLTTQDYWGPGEYEFTLVVPPVPHEYDGTPDASLPHPNVNIDAHCLSGYVMPLWMFQNYEVYNLFQPYDPAPPATDLAGGAGEPAAEPLSSTNSAGDRLQSPEGPGVSGGAAAAAARWLPSEQGTWSAHTTNVCAGDDGTGSGKDLAASAAKPVNAQVAAAAGKTPAVSLDYWKPVSTSASGAGFAELDWYNPATVKVGKAPVRQTCVPNSDTIGGGGQGAETGDAVTEEQVGSQTYKLLGCEVGGATPTGICTKDGDCTLAGFSCQTVGGQMRCMPELASSPLTAPLTAYYGYTGVDDFVANNCLAFQQSWQTGKFGSQWCGSAHSYGGDCLAAGTTDAEKRWLKNPGVQIATVELPSGTATVPSSPYFVQSAEFGGNLNGGLWGGNDSFVAVGSEIDVELPANTPVTDINRERAGGAWGMETFNANTWLGDNNSYTPAGATPWYTQAMVTHDWPSSVPSPWPKGGISKETCDQEFRAQRSFVSKPGGTASKGMTAAYAPVTYKIVWWADEKDPSASYVQFWVDGKLVYSTNRFVPTRACRWVIGPFPARWGGGYQSFDPGLDPRTQGSGGPRTISNSQAFDYVYVDLLSASFRPYNADFLPPGKTLADLKLRSIGNTYDQRFVGVTDADISAANTAGGPVVNVIEPTDATDRAWAGVTCRKDGSANTCEVRCGMRQLYDWSTEPSTPFASAAYDPTKTPEQAACKAAPLTWAAGMAAAAAPPSGPPGGRKAWLGVTIGSACALAGLAAVCAWLFVTTRRAGHATRAAPPKAPSPPNRASAFPPGS